MEEKRRRGGPRPGSGRPRQAETNQKHSISLSPAISRKLQAIAIAYCDGNKSHTIATILDWFDPEMFPEIFDYPLDKD